MLPEPLYTIHWFNDFGEKRPKIGKRGGGAKKMTLAAATEAMEEAEEHAQRVHGKTIQYHLERIKT